MILPGAAALILERAQQQVGGFYVFLVEGKWPCPEKFQDPSEWTEEAWNELRVWSLNRFSHIFSIVFLHTFAIEDTSLVSSTSLMGSPKQNWWQALGELFREATQDERQERLIQTSKRSQKPSIYPPGNQHIPSQRDFGR